MHLGDIKKNTGDSYILNPQTLNEFENNVLFQLRNVQGYMNSKAYESALVKAGVLVKALEELIQCENNLHDGNSEISK